MVMATVPEWEPCDSPVGLELVGPALMVNCKSTPLIEVLTDPAGDTWIQGFAVFTWMITVLGSELVET